MFVLFHIALGNVFRSIPVNIGVVVSMCVALAIRTMFSLTEFAFEYYRSETTTPLCEMSMWFEASALPGHATLSATELSAKSTTDNFTHDSSNDSAV